MINFDSFYFSIIHIFGVESFQAKVSQSAHVFNVYSNHRQPKNRFRKFYIND